MDNARKLRPFEEPKIQPRTYGDGVILLVEDEAPVRTFASCPHLRGYSDRDGLAEEALDQLRSKFEN